ncbi:MAG: hypothetical protein HY867_15540 [Chloroflexi bacterium]|nr:hypothetical protein [Chloroflexota bacterium]
MAKLLQAVTQYGPRVELKPTAKLEKVAEWVSMRTGLNKSEVMMVLQEMSEVVLYFNKDGVPVKLPGVGTFTPGVDGEGTYNIGFRADMDLKNGINTPNAYQGEVKNSERIGWTHQQYKELWDSEHPEDPLEIPD